MIILYALGAVGMLLLSLFFLLVLENSSLAQAAIRECPIEQEIVQPVDIMLVVDDSGSMRTEHRYKGARDAALAAVDFLFEKSPESKMGVFFMNKVGRGDPGPPPPVETVEISLLDKTKIVDIKNAINKLDDCEDPVDDLDCRVERTGATPTLETIRDAADQLNITDTRKDVILFFTDGACEHCHFTTPAEAGQILIGPLPTPPGATPMLTANQRDKITRAGVGFQLSETEKLPAYLGDHNLYFGIHTPPHPRVNPYFDYVKSLVSDPAKFAKNAPTKEELETILKGIIAEVIKRDPPEDFDFDEDGKWPVYCKDVPGNICGKLKPDGGNWPECTDYYDKPSDFGADDATWLDAFRGSLGKDLDGDGTDVADGRLPQGFPLSGGKDWYDNPFTGDLGSFKPAITQLSHTLNDLDLDTYITQSWRDRFGEGDRVEPAIADVAISAQDGKNRGGCVFPGALEETCSDCTAHVPDPATGRVPPTKVNPSETNPKDVCQLEAYYEDLGLKIVYPGPDADINASTPPNPFQGKKLLAVAAQCKDGVDNDMDGQEDDADLKCPKAGGLVPCGRTSDNPLTENDETISCNLCHLFKIPHNIITFLLVPSSFNNGFAIVPLIGILLLVIGGIYFLTSAGSPQRLGAGKNIFTAVIVGFFLIYGAWLFLNLFLMFVGVAPWTGLENWWQIKCEV